MQSPITEDDAKTIATFIRRSGIFLNPDAISWLISSVKDNPELARILKVHCSYFVTQNNRTDCIATDIVALMKQNYREHRSLTTPYDFDMTHDGLASKLQDYRVAYTTWWYSQRELRYEEFDEDVEDVIPERRVRARNN